MLEVPAKRPVAAAVLALLASFFTFLEFFTGEARVEVAGVVSTQVGEAEWPAYLGATLAAVLAIAAAVRLGANVKVPRAARPHRTA